MCKEEFDNSKVSSDTMVPIELFGLSAYSGLALQSMRNHYQHHHIKQDFPCEDCNYTAKHRAVSYLQLYTSRFVEFG